jgi:hypothetical protein
LRNPNPAMPDYREWPMSFDEFSKKNGNPFEPHGGSHGKALPAGESAGKGAH